MATVDVTCPYCKTGTTTSIPDETTVNKEVQSYKTGIRGKDKLVEVACSEGHNFGVTYK